MADETKLTAATRLEKLLDNIAGGENEVTPATRLEKFLSYIADAMEGGGGSGGGDSVLKVKVTKSGATYVLDKTGTEVKGAFDAGTPVYFYTEGDLFLPYDSNPPQVDEGNIKGAFLSDIENVEGRYFFIVYGAYFNEDNMLGDSLTFTTADLSNNPTAGGTL